MSERTLKVFIASSSAYIVEEKGLVNKKKTREGKLKALIDSIETAKCKPVPWWEENYVNGTIFDNIVESIKKCDLGIFILGKDVEITEKNPITATHVPNSNVLLEAGLFYSLRGVENTIIIKDEPEGVQIHLPSDIAGNIIPHISQTEKLRIKLLEKVENKNEQDTFDKKIFYRCPKLIDAIINKNYRSWGSKGLYINTESAVIWDRIEGIIEAEDIELIWDFLDKQIKRKDSPFNIHEIKNLISLGSGSGYTDEKITTKILIEHQNSLQYIPIDINPIMAFSASSKVKVKTPFTIIDDFEGDCEHIQKIIKDRTYNFGQNNLFIMSGLTFSNLAQNEDSIIANLKKIMCPNDYLVFSVSLISDKIGIEDMDEYKNDICNEIQKLFLKEGPYKQLLINSIVKKYFDLEKDSDELSKIQKDFDELIEVIAVEKNSLEHKSYTSISNAIVLECLFKKDIESEPFSTPLVVSKRYLYKDIEKKMKSTFSFVRSTSTKYTDRHNKAFFLVKN